MKLMGLPAAATLAAMLAAPAAADDGALCANPKQLDGFKTCADVAKAEKEGEVVIYSTNPEAGEATLTRWTSRISETGSRRAIRLFRALRAHVT